MKLASFRLFLILAYVVTFSAFGGIFATRAYYQAQIAEFNAQHGERLRMVQAEYDLSVERIEQRTLDRVRAENRAAQTEYYYRGVYVECFMQHMTFGLGFDCEKMVHAGWKHKMHKQEMRNTWPKFWREVISLGLDNG